MPTRNACSGTRRGQNGANPVPTFARTPIRFTHTTVPIGTRTAEYFITPMRGSATGRVGPSATVQFGSGRSVEPMQAIRRVA